MGYWGYDPEDGDAPLDYFYDVKLDASYALYDLVEKMTNATYLTSETKWEVIGAIMLTDKAGIQVPVSSVATALRWIGQIKRDYNWAGTWDTQSDAMKALRKTERRLLAIKKRSVDKRVRVHLYAPKVR